MKLLAERIDTQTGKRQFLAFVPRKDVQDEHTQQIAFDTSARQFGLSLDEKDDEIVYLNEETQRCWHFQQDGAWNGALSEMEMGFSTRSEEAQKRIIQQCFKQCAKLSGLAENSQLSGSLALSKIIGALDVVGAKKVRLIQPKADIQCADGEFIRVGSISSREIVS